MVFQGPFQPEVSYDLFLKKGNTTFGSAQLKAHLTLSMGCLPLSSFVPLKEATAIEQGYNTSQLLKKDVKYML